MTWTPAPIDAAEVVTPQWLSQALSQGRDPVEVTVRGYELSVRSF